VPKVATTNALILGRRPWSESSQIVTILTPEIGKLGVVARGARKLKTGVGPALEPITESELVLSLNREGDLGHVRSAEVVEFFSSLKHSFVRVTLGNALCELVDRTVPEYEESTSVYRHLRTGLTGVDLAADRDAINWLWWTALALASDLGDGLQFDECVCCGNAERPHPWYSVAEGGPVCGNCDVHAKQRWLVDSQDVLRWLSHASRDNVADRRISKKTNGDIRSLIERYYRYHVPNFDHLRSLKLLTADPAAQSEDSGETGE